MSSPFRVGGAHPDDLNHAAACIGINLCQADMGEVKGAATLLSVLQIERKAESRREEIAHLHLRFLF
jgi:hypothetical protein